jgi:hypothetical protein
MSGQFIRIRQSERPVRSKEVVMRPALFLTFAGMSVLAALACSESDSIGPFNRMLIPCDSPAILSGQPSRTAQSFIVAYRQGVDAQGETERLAAECGFQPEHVSQIEPAWFSANLDLVQVGCVRCDPVVSFVSVNRPVFGQ